MKNEMLLGVVFLVTGCPGPGDRMVDRESTTALIKDNQVCVLSPLEPQERITAIQIKSDNSDSLHKIFDDKPVYVPKGECLPVFGFKFTSGERYNFAYDVQSDKSESHLVTAELSYPKE
ncbi:putative T6SS immunity periplasmic lipoprotein [Enterobacter cloacae]|uniref:putative T6SS immunity periplasmic lipoprotein n=1 Tax=Enterobacter cloacae TaxID=550 RepID=UPI003BEF3501